MKVAAIFDKPECCEECACYEEAYKEYDGYCRLIDLLDPKMASTIKDEYAASPEWCPLQPLTIIGPADDIQDA